MGLPGAGKTTLAVELAPILNAVWFNADEIRTNINTHLGFSKEDRIEQARRMGFLCDIVTKAGHYAIADFVCPTPETRAAFDPDFIVWVDRVPIRNYEDTTQLFVKPKRYDVRIENDMPADYQAEEIKKIIEFTWKSN